MCDMHPNFDPRLFLKYSGPRCVFLLSAEECGCAKRAQVYQSGLFYVRYLFRSSTASHFSFLHIQRCVCVFEVLISHKDGE